MVVEEPNCWIEYSIVRGPSEGRSAAELRVDRPADTFERLEFLEKMVSDGEN